MMHYILHHFNDAIMGSVMKDQHQNQTKVNRAQGKVRFYYKKRKWGIDVVCYQVPNHVVKFINEKRGAIFDIYLQRKKTESKILRQILCFIVRVGLCWNYTISSGDALFWIIISKTLFENVTIQCSIVEMDLILIIMVSVCWERHIDMYYFDEYFVVLCIWLTITCVIGTIFYVYLIFICFMNKIFWE